jgi:hypothetical protein
MHSDLLAIIQVRVLFAITLLRFGIAEGVARGLSR